MAYRVISSENRAAASTSAKSGAAPATTRAVILTAYTQPVRIRIGSEPVATSADVYLPVGHPYEFSVTAGEKIAAIRADTIDGAVNIVWCH